MRDNETNLRLTERALIRGARFAFDRNLTSFDPRDTLLRFSVMAWAATHPTLVGRVIMSIGNRLSSAFPFTLRSICGVRPNCESQSLMLAIMLCIHLDKIEGEDWASRIDRLFSELMARAITDDKGMGWSSPNPFQVHEPGGNVVIVTATSRVVHTTLLAANVLMLPTFLLGNERARDAVRKIAKFLAHGIFRTVLPSGALAFAYSDVDQSRIINVTAETASFLVRAGRAFDRADWVEIGLGGARFVLESMRSDGSWGYEAEASSPVDNCHTVMNLKSLLEILEENASSRIDAVERMASQIRGVVDRGLRYYLDTFFREDGMAKFVSTSRPVERSYDTAYAIRMLIAVVKSSLFDEGQRGECDALLERVVGYALTHNQRENGEFILRRRGGKEYWFPNMRYGQLQMCVALAEYRELRQMHAAESA